MSLPQRSTSQTVRVPHFLRASTVQRPARFGPPAQVLPAEALPDDAVTGSSPGGNDAAPAADPPMITMPTAPSVDVSDDAVPSILVDEPVADANLKSAVDDDAATSEAVETAAGSGEDSPPEGPTGPMLNPEVLATLEDTLAQIGESARQDALALGLALARRLVGLYIDADEVALTKLVDDAMTRLQPTNALEICLHPDDIAMLNGAGPKNAEDEDQPASPIVDDVEKDDAKEAAADIATKFNGAGASLTISSDPSLARGEALVRTDLGEIDATLDARIKVAQAALEGLE